MNTRLVVLATVVFASAADAQATGVVSRAGARFRQARTSIDSAAKVRQAKKSTARFDPIFKKYTKRYFGIGTDWRLFKAQGMAESDLTPDATSRVGARGIMQLMPATYGHIQSALPSFGAIDNPEWNIAAGILHDRDLWTLFKKDVPDSTRWDFVFAGYNAGEGTIMRARRTAAAAQLDNSHWNSIEQIAPTVQRWRYTETLDYVRKIRKNHAAIVVTP